MYVHLRTLERAVKLVDQLADLDDPDDFRSLVMAGLNDLIGCDVVTYDEFHRLDEYSDVDRAVLAVMRRPLIAAMQRTRLRAAARAVTDVPVVPEFSALTPREAQVMRLVAEGRTNEAIAHTLAISPRTVAKHLERIYRKLHAPNRAAAVSRATSLPA